MGEPHKSAFDIARDAVDKELLHLVPNNQARDNFRAMLSDLLRVHDNQRAMTHSIVAMICGLTLGAVGGIIGSVVTSKALAVWLTVGCPACPPPTAVTPVWENRYDGTIIRHDPPIGIQTATPGDWNCLRYEREPNVILCTPRVTRTHNPEQPPFPVEAP